jgi:hypothetical protein
MVQRFNYLVLIGSQLVRIYIDLVRPIILEQVKRWIFIGSQFKRMVVFTKLVEQAFGFIIVTFFNV